MPKFTFNVLNDYQPVDFYSIHVTEQIICTFFAHYSYCRLDQGVFSGGVRILGYHIPFSYILDSLKLAIHPKKRRENFPATKIALLFMVLM